MTREVLHFGSFAKAIADRGQERKQFINKLLGLVPYVSAGFIIIGLVTVVGVVRTILAASPPARMIYHGVRRILEIAWGLLGFGVIALLVALLFF
jgi:hypothetical protein